MILPLVGVLARGEWNATCNGDDAVTGEHVIGAEGSVGIGGGCGGCCCGGSCCGGNCCIGSIGRLRAADANVVDMGKACGEAGGGGYS